jgi:hypothetical protein
VNFSERYGRVHSATSVKATLPSEFHPGGESVAPGPSGAHFTARFGLGGSGEAAKDPGSSTTEKPPVWRPWENTTLHFAWVKLVQIAGLIAGDRSEHCRYFSANTRASDSPIDSHGADARSTPASRPEEALAHRDNLVGHLRRRHHPPDGRSSNRYPVRGRRINGSQRG